MTQRPVDPARPRPRPRTDPIALARRQQAQTVQVAQAAGGAIVTVARVGRLLGRSGWRLARQVPGVAVMEEQAARMSQVATAEFARLAQLPQPGPHAAPGPPRTLTFEEERAALLLQGAEHDPDPLRTAMGELLARASGSDGVPGRDYLFGNLVSQLVPDEARILAALSGGNTFAVLDISSKGMGRPIRTVLANASTVGTRAGITKVGTVATYLTRLAGLGLVEFGDLTPALAEQFDLLERDEAVRAARTEADGGRFGGARITRKSVTLSALGREFWAACAPPGGLDARR